ncbi:MAG: SPOR domain-containing protein [Desulfobacterales bacterium]|nr:SPOR domain-containing protein [Desulfobacterales bacterium]
MKWIFLILFISAWMFILGIFVGRGTAPVKFDINKLQKELAAYKKIAAQKELSRFNLNPNSGLEPEFGFYEDLKHTKNDVKQKTEKFQIKPKSIARKSNLEKKKQIVTEDTPKKVKNVDSTQKAKTSSLNSNDLTDKKITIQVASLKNLKVADQMVARLKKKGYSAYRTIAKIPGKGNWYRIRIGYFKNIAEAQSIFNQLKKEKFKPIFVNRQS